MSVAAPPSVSSTMPRAAAPAPAAFARVDVLGDPAEALAAWRELAPEKRGSFYQSESFVLAWLRIFGPRRKATPFFVVARDASNAPLAVLPLALFRFGPLRVAQFPGEKHSNYNLGLFRAGADLSAQDLKLLLRAAARAAPGGPHLYRLQSLPPVWRGAANPLVLLDHGRRPVPPAPRCWRRTAKPFWRAGFPPTRARNCARRKNASPPWGRCAISALADAREKRKVLDAFFAHKAGRPEFRLGPAERDALRDFYGALAEGGAELHALALDDRIVAALGAGANGGRLQGMFISYDPDPEIAKTSPAKSCSLHVLRDACARKFSAFDLGIGEARYKAAFCDEVEELADALYAPTFLGRLALPLFALAAAAKRTIKANPKLLAAAEKIRRA